MHLQKTKSKNNKKTSGFSLLELLIVMAILVIVMTAVMSTLNITSKASFTNRELVDSQQNLRSASKLISDEIVTLGQNFMGQITNDSVYVRSGFLSSMGFPSTDVQTPPSSPIYDELFAVQAANNTISATLVNGLDPNGAAITNTRVYDGSGPSGKPTLYHLGTDQLLIIQQDLIDLQFADDYGLVSPDSNTLPETAIANYQAKAVFTGSNLRLDPIVTVPSSSNLNASDSAALIPAYNASDAILASRIQPNVDVLILQDINGGPQFLGLVTAANTGNGQINLDFNDPILVNPDWSKAVSTAVGSQPKLCANNATVSIKRGKLIQYYVGSPITAAPGIPLNDSILYRREGARLDPLAFNIENLQFSFLLVDEIDIDGDGIGQFYTVPNATVSFLGAGSWTGAPAAPAGDPSRTRRWDRTAIRGLITTLYARSDSKDRSLIQTDSSLSNVIDRGYYHVEQEATTSLRNAAYNR